MCLNCPGEFIAKEEVAVLQKILVVFSVLLNIAKKRYSSLTKIIAT